MKEDSNEPAMSKVVAGEGSMEEVTRNRSGEYRSPNFYKDRREMTRSPLGPDASVEETRTAITRGFKRPQERELPYAEKEKEERKSFRKRKGGFFRRLFGSS